MPNIRIHLTGYNVPRPLPPAGNSHRSAADSHLNERALLTMCKLIACNIVSLDGFFLDEATVTAKFEPSSRVESRC